MSLNFKDLQGSYVLNTKTQYIFDPTPPFDAKKYLASWIFTLDMSNVTLASGMTDGSVQVVLNRALMKNINPYEMELIGVKLSNPFVKKETIPFNNTGLYHLDSSFEISFSTLQSMKRNYIAFQYYVKAIVEGDFKQKLRISYPRDIERQLFYYSSQMILLLSYDNAPVIDPDQIDSSPAIQLEYAYDGGVKIPEPYDYNLIAIDLSVFNVGTTPLHQRMSISFDYSKKSGFVSYSSLDRTAKFVDPMSIVCAYEENGKIVVDENSQVLEVTSRNSVNSYQSFVLTCSDRQLTSDFTLFMFARKYDDRTRAVCKFGTECGITSYMIASYELKNGEQYDNLIASFDKNSKLSGSFMINNQNTAIYSKYAAPSTIQKPLSLKFAFSIDFTAHRLDVSDNMIYFEYTNSLQPHVDPFSMRVTILNESTNSFELFQPDIPKLGEAKWAFDPTVYNNTNLVFGLWIYDKSTAVLGEAVFVNYARNIEYHNLDNLNVTVYFEKVEIRPETQSRPFYVLDKFEGDSNNVVDESLEIMNYDEGRIFKFLPSMSFSDKNGNAIDVKFSEMTCAYLIKDSNGAYSTIEYSDDKPTFSQDPVDKVSKYFLDCSEDIRATEFIVLLISKKFKREEHVINFGEPVTIDPFFLSKFVTGWSDKDILQVTVNPNSDLKGQFTLANRDVSSYQDFIFPHTIQQPLTILGVFDLYHITVSTSDVFDFNAITVEFIKSSSIFNVDPKSFRIFKVHTKSKIFELLFDDQPFEGPWKLEIDTRTGSDTSYTFAICAFEGSSANFEQEYSIYYSRMLEFSLEKDKLEFSFQLTTDNTEISQEVEPSFKLVRNETVGQLIIDPVSKSDYYSIYSFDISQNLLSFGVKSWREFTISNLDKELDNSTLACAFAFGKDNLHISPEKATFKDGSFHLNCQENVMVNSYQLYVVAKKIFIPPTPTPSPSVPPQPIPSPSRPRPEPSVIPPKPEPTIVPPKPSPSIPRPIPSYSKGPHPIPSPQPNPITSFERENGIPLIQDSTISKKIQSGESALYQITIPSHSRLSLSCSTLSGKDVIVLVGQNFKPTNQHYSVRMLSNHIQSLDNPSSNSQIYFIAIEGPSEGFSQFTLLPSVTQLNVKSSSSQHLLGQSITGFIVTIVLLTLSLIGTLILFLACGIYWKKKNNLQYSQETTGLVRRGNPNSLQLEASYYSENNL
ncbi:predicted protein [Naegleria gruberi]|uniref:Predicted protein n=1 Tax=Naegleria gruberi TaxID=5762 RepID=D2VYF6_NAEGR|nr:uncharacterized protein NAEGRDRAFT_74103 [Naegleria gruberi]EFC38104.1 predicted protein [Naegleria gruberi]|eukprot:XP_002670848.1 predicted protein [Naegleria gruberi strain NEG-M]